MIIQVYLKRVYGIDRFYPANELAKIICLLNDRKTIDLDQLAICKKFGWQVDIVPEVLNL